MFGRKNCGEKILGSVWYRVAAIRAGVCHSFSQVGLITCYHKKNISLPGKSQVENLQKQCQICKILHFKSKSHPMNVLYFHIFVFAEVFSKAGDKNIEAPAEEVVVLAP